MKDTKETIKCPACGKEMKKVFIEGANCNVDICTDGCGGIFVDNREYKKFDEQHESIDKILEAYKGKTFSKQDQTKVRTCPVCDSKMIKNYASSMQKVEIDQCYSCGGIFLDYGELQAIREQYKTEKDRQDAFKNYFETQIDISEFKDYKSKTPEELFGKTRTAVVEVLKKYFN